MTSKKDATSQKSMILSPTDIKIAKLKFEAGDKFFLKRDSLTVQAYSRHMRGALAQKKVVVEVDSYEVNHMGEVGYRLSFLDSELDWRWFVTEDILEEDFIYLGKNISDTRFFMIDDE